MRFVLARLECARPGINLLNSVNSHRCHSLTHPTGTPPRREGGKEGGGSVTYCVRLVLFVCVVFVHRSIESLLNSFQVKLNVFRVAAISRPAPRPPDLDILGRRKGGGRGRRQRAGRQAGRQAGRVDLHSSLVEPILPSVRASASGGDLEME